MAEAEAIDVAPSAEKEDENPSPPRAKLTNIQRFKAPYEIVNTIVKEMPASVFKSAVITRSELYAQHRQRYYTKKHEKEQKKNTIISIYKEDVLTRVLMSESLPYLCALCGESFAHTTPLREHAEQAHSYFQAVAKKKPNKTQVIIERSFDPKKGAESSKPAGEDDSRSLDAGNAVNGINGRTEDADIRDCSLALEEDLQNSSDEEMRTKLTEGFKAVDTSGNEQFDESSLPMMQLNDDLQGEQSEMIGISGMDLKSMESNNAEGSVIVKKKEKKKKKKKTKEYELVTPKSVIRVRAVNGEEAPDDKSKKKKNQNPTPCCVVCGVRNKTRVIYKHHLAEAHHIFSSAEEAFEYGKKLNLLGGSLDTEAEANDGEENSGTEGKKMMKCDYCETFVFDKTLLQKHMRAHCGLPGLKCDICTEGIRLWEEGKMTEVRGLMETFLSKDRREQDVDYMVEGEEGGVDEEGQADPASVGDKKRRSIRFSYSNIVSTCYECGEKYYMRYHMGLHHKKAHSSLTCKECNVFVPSLQALKNHSMKNHDKGIFRCPYCPRAFHDRGKYNYHHAGHMGIYKCPGCGRSFLEKPSLDNHLKKYATHPTHFEGTEIMKEEYSLEKPYIFDGFVEKPDTNPIQLICPICEAEFINAGNLTKHMNARHPELLNTETNFVCDICGKLFGSRKNLLAHQKTHVRRYLCAFEGCNKAYHMLHKLKEHVHTHSTTLNFHCDQCEKSFKTMASLRFHKRVHNQDAPVYQCGLCQRVCRTRTDLRYHVEGVHSNERNYQCDVCGKRFTSKLRLANHKTVHKEKKFLCDKCPASFRAKHFLEVHQRTHNKPYPCKLCSKSFNKNEVYQRHLYTKHNVGEPLPKRVYNSNKRKAPVSLQEPEEQQFDEDEVVNVRVEFPAGEDMTNEAIVALITGINPLH